MLFFIGVYVVIAVRVFRARTEEMEARARLALEGDGGGDPQVRSGAGPDA
jgi:hypothetical protein